MSSKKKQEETKVKIPEKKKAPIQFKKPKRIYDSHVSSSQRNLGDLNYRLRLELARRKRRRRN